MFNGIGSGGQGGKFLAWKQKIHCPVDQGYKGMLLKQKCPF